MPKPAPKRTGDDDATSLQVNYLEILFNDCGFNRLQRNDWLSERIGREIRFLVQLSRKEASDTIQELNARKKSSRDEFERVRFEEEDHGWNLKS